MTVVIRYPLNRAAERAYIVDVVVGEFLGLEFATIPEIRDDVSITFPGSDSELRVADVLFQTSDMDWLQRNSLPVLPLEQWQLPAEISESIDIRIDSVPVVFGRSSGSGQFMVREDSTINLGLDIFGSAFYMLTRYEEACSPSLDGHDRFPASASLSARAGFIERPIVNEYLEVLWACISTLCPGLARKQREYEFVVSHDVDKIFDTRDRSWPAVMRNVIGDVTKRRDVTIAAKRIYSKAVSGSGDYSNEPCSSFDFIMDCSEQYNIRSAFYFIAHQSSEGLDGDYTIDMPWVRYLLRHIHTRGHELGLHASYNSYNDPAQIAAELFALQAAADEENVNQNVWGGRQHYLRWAAGTTWQGWEDAGLAYDSTLTFPEAPGFRSGTCFEYPTFNLGSSSRLQLRERPLIVMETSLFSEAYMNLSSSDALDAIIRLSATCRHFGGQFTMLWHNDNLSSGSQKRLYRDALEAVV